jgi:transposase
MAMGTRKKRERQEDLWVVSSEVVGTPAHAFYERLNQVLAQHHFDRNVEQLCRRYYKGSKGRPSITPGVYFRSLLLGYFEGIDSERGIAWRLADSLSMRKFICYALTEETPDHSTLSRTRRLYSVETHKAVFRWVLKILSEEGLVEGKTVSIDATTLEANAALRSLVRRDSGQKYDAYLKELAKAAGIENPTREQLARLDRKRKKKGSNKEWKNPFDPDCRSYIPEPDRGQRNWEGKHEEKKRVYANRRRTRGERSKGLQRTRSELTERSMAHMYETGAMRRVHLKGRNNILKRLLVHAGGFNLALILRKLMGVGKPRQMQGILACMFTRLGLLFFCAWTALRNGLGFCIARWERVVTFLRAVTFLCHLPSCAFFVVSD